MSDYSFKASLRISSVQLQPSEVSRILQTEASVTYLVGELKSPRNPKSQLYDENLWIYRSDLNESATFQDHVGVLVDLLERVDPAIYDQLRSKLTDIDLFCMFRSTNGQGSAELDANILQRLGRLKVGIVIDLYPPV